MPISREKSTSGDCFYERAGCPVKKKRERKVVKKEGEKGCKKRGRERL